MSGWENLPSGFSGFPLVPELAVPENPKLLFSTNSMKFTLGCIVISICITASLILLCAG